MNGPPPNIPCSPGFTVRQSSWNWGPKRVPRMPATDKVIRRWIADENQTGFWARKRGIWYRSLGSKNSSTFFLLQPARRQAPSENLTLLGFLVFPLNLRKWREPSAIYIRLLFRARGSLKRAQGPKRTIIYHQEVQAIADLPKFG